MGNKLIDILEDAGALGWPTLQIGFNRGWVSRPDIVDFATREIERNADATDTVCLLALSDDLDDRDFQDHLAETCPEIDDVLELRKWKYAKLSEIQSNTRLSREEKYDLLQPLYAMLDYPEDLHPIWMFRQTHNDAIEHRDDLVARMSVELTGSSTRNTG